ncbi:hypothetical protein J6590_067548 [Homalodisca vitripennis]|nr:hypothetical protein J6590_067548 [Homalodisca vitripennis]
MTSRAGDMTPSSSARKRVVINNRVSGPLQTSKGPGDCSVSHVLLCLLHQHSVTGLANFNHVYTFTSFAAQERKACSGNNL